MSKYYRQKRIWPMSLYARFCWLAFGLWEDIQSLTDAYKEISDENVRVVITRHILVDFDTLDELFKEFHGHVKKQEVDKLSSDDAKIILDAFTNYHKVVEPQRRLLKDIRNNLGAHRTGMPEVKAKMSGVSSTNEWGKWEQTLVNLESQCNLTDWVDVINAAYKLLIILKDFNLDAWFDWLENGEIRFFMPFQTPGYYRRDPQEY